MLTEAPLLAQTQHRLLHDIYALLEDDDRRVFEFAKLSPLEFAVLQRLDLNQGHRLTDLGAELLCVKSTVTRLVDRLEASGLVRRTPDPQDRRAQRLMLTPRGNLVRAEAAVLHNTAVERRMSLLTGDEQQMLQTLLEKLLKGLAGNLAEQREPAAPTGSFEADTPRLSG